MVFHYANEQRPAVVVLIVRTSPLLRECLNLRTVSAKSGGGQHDPSPIGSCSPQMCLYAVTVLRDQVSGRACDKNNDAVTVVFCKSRHGGHRGSLATLDVAANQAGAR